MITAPISDYYTPFYKLSNSANVVLHCCELNFNTGSLSTAIRLLRKAVLKENASIMRAASLTQVACINSHLRQ